MAWLSWKYCGIGRLKCNPMERARPKDHPGAPVCAKCIYKEHSCEARGRSCSPPLLLSPSRLNNSALLPAVALQQTQIRLVYFYSYSLFLSQEDVVKLACAFHKRFFSAWRGTSCSATGKGSQRLTMQMGTDDLSQQPISLPRIHRLRNIKHRVVEALNRTTRKRHQNYFMNCWGVLI